MYNNFNYRSPLEFDYSSAGVLRSKIIQAVKTENFEELNKILNAAQSSVQYEDDSNLTKALKYNADENYLDAKNPILIAARCRSSAALAALLPCYLAAQNNIDDEYIGFIKSALVEAAQRGVIDNVKLILNLPVIKNISLTNPELKDKVGKLKVSALQSAMEYGQTTIAGLLLDDPDVIAKIDVNFPIYIKFASAAATGSLDIVNKLLGLGSIVRRLNEKQSDTAIQAFRLAAKREHYHIIARLLELEKGREMIKNAFAWAAVDGEDFLMERYSGYQVIQDELTKANSEMCIEAMMNAWRLETEKTAKYILELDFGTEYFFAALSKIQEECQPNEKLKLNDFQRNMMLSILVNIIHGYNESKDKIQQMERIKALLSFEEVRLNAHAKNNLLLQYAKQLEVPGQEIVKLLMQIDGVKDLEQVAQNIEREHKSILKMLENKLSADDHELLKNVLVDSISLNIVTHPVITVTEQEINGVKTRVGHTNNQIELESWLQMSSKSPCGSGSDIVTIDGKIIFPNIAINKLFEYIRESPAPVNILDFPGFNDASGVVVKDPYHDLDGNIYEGNNHEATLIRDTMFRNIKDEFLPLKSREHRKPNLRT